MRVDGVRLGICSLDASFLLFGLASSYASPHACAQCERQGYLRYPWHAGCSWPSAGTALDSSHDRRARHEAGRTARAAWGSLLLVCVLLHPYMPSLFTIIFFSCPMVDSSHRNNPFLGQLGPLALLFYSQRAILQLFKTPLVFATAPSFPRSAIHAWRAAGFQRCNGQSSRFPAGNLPFAGPVLIRVQGHG
jgi:hypothetical protein